MSSSFVVCVWDKKEDATKFERRQGDRRQQLTRRRLEQVVAVDVWGPCVWDEKEDAALITLTATFKLLSGASTNQPAR